jgi:outer membrane protein assembly factor BamA
MQPTTLTLQAAIAAALLAAAPAWAQQSFKIGTIVINGVTSVPIQPLYSALKEHPGDVVTTNDVLADQDNLEKALESAHITGGIKTSLRNNPHNKDIIFDVKDNGVTKPVVTTTALHLAHVSFAGNKNEKSDDLLAAAQMKPGDVVTDQSIADALARIGASYKKASINAQDEATTNIVPTITYPIPGQVDIVWTFTEKVKAKKKKRNTEDDGMKMDSN